MDSWWGALNGTRVADLLTLDEMHEQQQTTMASASDIGFHERCNYVRWSRL